MTPGENTFFEDPQFRRLFAAYSDSKTPGRDSIADHLSVLSLREHTADPLIVATSTHIAFYPGDGLTPQVQGFRLQIPGFTELTAISHLGPALGTLVALKQRGEEALWRDDAGRLLERTREVRASSTAALWGRELDIPAFAGREEAIATMVDYACALAISYLERTLHEPGYLSPESLRRDYLEVNTAEFPVSGNKLMVATFALYALDHAFRLRQWTGRVGLDWDRVLFVITGRQGRPTAGLTKSTTSLVRVLRHLSENRLALDRTFIMPTAPGFDPPHGDDLSGVVAAEAPLRWLLARVMSSVELAPLMFDGYPRFAEPPLLGAELREGAMEVSEFPPIRGRDDWVTMITRLRLTLEDPRQLLATGVTDFIAEQLMRVHGNPSAVVVPGLDTERFPPIT
ncbi:DUF5624 domain-containing protein [Diaminobutyricibacter sp. McL0618]|uniref:DUF5624 domain-containing protein n=1 Tax=Leifsonia sp. McL0618 TaxID=3415677 RepID=UPI003CF5BBFD